MREEQVYFESDGLTIEGLYAPRPGQRGVVVTHPHPLMGGSMRNNVVMALVSVFQRYGFSTLRFNFRGVGRSGGVFDDGRGEVGDLRAAVSFLSDEGVTEIALAGYSFGAVVAASYLTEGSFIDRVVLVSPPLAEAGLEIPMLRGKKGLLVCGDDDYFCPVDALKKVALQLSWGAAVIAGADHFYFGREKDLMDAVENWLAADVGPKSGEETRE
ncbi:MAG TPA: alpha/beta hydrolase [Syntrophales bacterium]|nr:alpha/beta hydrolase [Syntrophobacterales bacterium]HRT28135.1 alpha/beta hydrolase [Syntrophales bacterium]HRT70508.1 alpha/beta hydrolase [Syntrophales bacterium]